MWCRMLDIVPLIRMILGSSAYPMAKIVVAGSVDCVGGQKILIGVFKVSAREEIQKITRIKHHKIVLFGVITCLFKILECVIEVLKSTSLVALVIKRYMYVGYMKKFQLVSEAYIKRCFYYLKLLHVFLLCKRLCIFIKTILTRPRGFVKLCAEFREIKINIKLL